MKAYLVILGLLLLFKNQVHPLTCFVCEQQPNNVHCLHLKKCAEEEKFCVTTVGSYEIGLLTIRKIITKKCSSSCPDLQMMVGFASFGTSCCQHSWCNIWGHLVHSNATR